MSEGLGQLKEIFEKPMANNAGSKNSLYGKIEHGYLTYDGKSYKIMNVCPGVLELDTNSLFGKYGDEFPLDMVR
jgi:hypothetical protein